MINVLIMVLLIKQLAEHFSDLKMLYKKNYLQWTKKKFVKKKRNTQNTLKMESTLVPKSQKTTQDMDTSTKTTLILANML